MKKNYGINRIMGTKAGTPLLEVNKDKWAYPMNLHKFCEESGIELFGFLYAIKDLAARFNYAGDNVVYLEDCNNNEYSVTVHSEHHKMDCCGQPQKCPYLDSVNVELSSFRYSNFFARSFGFGGNSIAPKIKVDTIHNNNPYDLAIDLYRDIDKKLDNGYKIKICNGNSHELKNIQIRFSGKNEGVLNQKGIATGALVYPLLNRMFIRENPLIIGKGDLPRMDFTQQNDLIDGRDRMVDDWINAITSYARKVTNDWEKLIYQTKGRFILIRKGDQAESLYCLFGNIDPRGESLGNLKQMLDFAFTGPKKVPSLDTMLMSNYSQIIRNSPETQGEALRKAMLPCLKEVLGYTTRIFGI